MAPHAAGASAEIQPGNAVTEYSPLQPEIEKLIKSAGPMPVWRYMELCLTHPEHGYYVSRDPLGREGDFTTAPESARCSANCSGCGPPRCGGAGFTAAGGWSNSGPAAHMMADDAPRGPGARRCIRRSTSIVEINPVLREKQSNIVRRPQHLWHGAHRRGA
jgi:hypothetical protein